MTFTASGKAAL